MNEQKRAVITVLCYDNEQFRGILNLGIVDDVKQANSLILDNILEDAENNKNLIFSFEEDDFGDSFIRTVETGERNNFEKRYYISRYDTDGQAVS